MTALGVRVLKFGGSSVADPAVMRRAAMVTTAALSKDGRPGSGPGVVVVSALGGVTRELVRIAEAALDGNGATVAQGTRQLRRRHSDFLVQLDLGEPDTGKVQALIDDRFDELGDVLARCPGETDGTREHAAFEDAVLAFGELLASQLFWCVLRSLGVRCQWMDARDFLRTDDRFGAATPDLERTRELARAAMGPILADGHSVIVPGFIGATADGTPTTMGFEASDLTATVLASALDAHEVQIWTDVSGVLSADPRVVPTATPIPHLDYDGARELAFLGARVLHPDTMHPARGSGISVRVVNCSRPGDAGTVIDEAGAPQSESAGVVVTSRGSQEVVRVAVGPDLAGPVLAFLRDMASQRRIDDALFATESRSPGEVDVIVVCRPNSELSVLETAAAQFGEVSRGGGWSAVSIIACNNERPDWPLADVPSVDWVGLDRSRGTLVPDDQRASTVRDVHAHCKGLQDTADEGQG